MTRTNNKLNPHMTQSPGIELGPHWWEASALTTAPSLLPLLVTEVSELPTLKLATDGAMLLEMARNAAHCSKVLTHFVLAVSPAATTLITFKV